MYLAEIMGILLHVLQQRLDGLSANAIPGANVVVVVLLDDQIISNLNPLLYREISELPPLVPSGATYILWIVAIQLLAMQSLLAV